MSEQEYISSKIPVLIKEGYAKPQAYMIAKSMFRKQSAQQGLTFIDNEYQSSLDKSDAITNNQYSSASIENPDGINFGKYGGKNYFRAGSVVNGERIIENTETYPWNYDAMKNSLEELRKLNPGIKLKQQYINYKQGKEYYQQAGQWQNPIWNMSQYYQPQYNTNPFVLEDLIPNRNTTQSLQDGNIPQQRQPVTSVNQLESAPLNMNFIPSSQELLRQNVAPANESISNWGSDRNKEQVENQRYNINNPYGGMDLSSALNFTGNAFGEGNVGMGVAGAGLSLLKGARSFLTGFATGRENNRVRNEYMDERFNYNPIYQPLQQGGQLKNSEFLTGQFITDEGQGNVNLENSEYVRRYNTGDIQQVVGEPHIINGKKADGVDATLDTGDKVLSDYTKIPAKDIKELKERYQLSLKKGATFADAQKAFDRKLGIPKITKELSEHIEKFGKNNSVKDETAKRLNEMVIAKQIEEKKGKLEALKDPQSMVFEDLFAKQEALPKRGNGSQLYDKNGKEVTETNTDVAQQGGYIDVAKKHGISPQRAKELIKMQMGGEQQDPMQQVFQAVAQMLQEGLPPEQIAQQLVQMGVPQEQVGQVIEQVAAQIQQQPQQQAQQGLDYRDINDTEYLALNNTLKSNNNLEFTREGADSLFGTLNPQDYPQTPPLDLGKYKGLNYYDVQLKGDEYYLYPTKTNIQNPDSYKTALDYLKKQNPNVKFGRDTYIPMINRQEGGITVAPEELRSPYWNIATRYTPIVEGYTTSANTILNQDYLEGVERVQPYTGEGYGAKMSDVENTINTHTWYFDTDEKKSAFREASKKEGEQPEIKKFQEAYNQEIEKRAKSVGLSEAEIKKTVEEIGFTGKGVQGFDGKFGAFTSTRPLVNFNKTPEGEVVKEEVKPQPEQVAPVVEENAQQVPVNTTKNVNAWLPQKMFLPPSPLDPIAPQQIALPRMEALKMSEETMLAEQERQRQTEIARAQEMGLTTQQQAALTAQGLATSQLSANDAINKVSTFNAQSQAKSDQFNMGQRTKEEITNTQLRQDYEAKVLGGQNNYETNLRNFYNDIYLDQTNKFRYIDDMNLINAENSNYQTLPGSGVRFLNTNGTDLSIPSLTREQVDKMTPEQRLEYMRMVSAKQKYGVK